jgi:hypothetical protein
MAVGGRYFAASPISRVFDAQNACSGVISVCMYFLLVGEVKLSNIHAVVSRFNSRLLLAML